MLEVVNTERDVVRKVSEEEIKEFKSTHMYDTASYRT